MYISLSVAECQAVFGWKRKPTELRPAVRDFMRVASDTEAIEKKIKYGYNVYHYGNDVKIFLGEI